MTHGNTYKLRIKPVAKTLLRLHDLGKNLPGVDSMFLSCHVSVSGQFG